MAGIAELLTLGRKSVGPNSRVTVKIATTNPPPNTIMYAMPDQCSKENMEARFKNADFSENAFPSNPPTLPNSMSFGRFFR